MPVEKYRVPKVCSDGVKQGGAVEHQTEGQYEESRGENNQGYFTRAW